jgi:hypothetical protein
MRKVLFVLAIPLATLTLACRGKDTSLDDALKNDLALAAQAQPYNPQAFVSPVEQGYGANPYGPNGYAPQNYQAVARQPVAAQPVRSTSTARRSSSGSSSSGSRVYYPAPRERVEKHTGRDAAIGAAAGAVIGATASRDKVKGGLIGAAIGGILGGVVGNNVDVKRTTVP